MGVKMKKDGVTYEELEELAAQIGFELKSDDDYLRLFREARKLGWWPELDQPRMNTKTWWTPPDEADIRYRPNPFPDSTPVGQKKESPAKLKKEASMVELETLARRIKELENDPRIKDQVVANKLEGLKNLDSWLDDIH